MRIVLLFLILSTLFFGVLLYGRLRNSGESYVALKDIGERMEDERHFVIVAKGEEDEDGLKHKYGSGDTDYAVTKQRWPKNIRAWEDY